MKKRLFVLIIGLLSFISMVTNCLGEVVSRNPLLTPPVIEEYTQTEDEFINILLLGIDYGGDTYKTKGSGGCVNVPLENMAKMYELVPDYTPVVIYDEHYYN